MSYTVNVTASTVEELRDAVLALLAVTQNRKIFGWRRFQRDEVYEYNSQHDDRVCPVCYGFDLEHTFYGDEVPIKFPSNLHGSTMPELVLPNVHIDHPELEGVCRCSMTWLNYPYVLAERLTDEMQEAV